MNMNKRFRKLTLVAALAATAAIAAVGAAYAAPSPSPSPQPSAAASGAPDAAQKPAPPARQQDGANKPKPQDGGRKGPACTNGDGAGQQPPAPAGGNGGPGGPGNRGAGIDSVTEQDGVTVTISGGFDTDPQDHGRPVVLIAAALGVPTEVFREAFSGVHPAGLDSGGPTEAEARTNKAALLKVLTPYGITNDRLDEVSNYYRYNGNQQATWKKTLATAVPVIENGVVTGITITNPGAGYSSAPTVTIKGPQGTVTATATVKYTSDFATNGGIASITLN
ncbi:MAG: hypothetical protein J7639_10840 [Paenibacillaceae bacterium]|nr:hypothetical protein [Paenibacillaceae bacterium]